MKASTFSKEEAMARYVTVALSVVKSRGKGSTPDWATRRLGLAM